jgi:hypothetical protein
MAKIGPIFENEQRSGRSMVVICHDGNASFLATSTLRHREVEVFNDKGEFERLRGML